MTSLASVPAIVSAMCWMARVSVDARGEPYRIDAHDRTVADAQEIAVGHVVVHQ